MDAYASPSVVDRRERKEEGAVVAAKALVGINYPFDGQEEEKLRCLR